MSYVLSYKWDQSVDFEDQVQQLDEKRRKLAEEESEPIPENQLDKLIDIVERLLARFVCKNENQRDLA